MEEGTEAGSGGTQESAAKAAQKRNVEEEYHRPCQAEGDAYACITNTFLAHTAPQSQHPPPSVPILECPEAHTHHQNTL